MNRNPNNVSVDDDSSALSDLENHVVLSKTDNVVDETTATSQTDTSQDKYDLQFDIVEENRKKVSIELDKLNYQPDDQQRLYQAINIIKELCNLSNSLYALIAAQHNYFSQQTDDEL
jgi:hypothetical protein